MSGDLVSKVIGTPMDIHFCDLCNESVPATDLEAGKAFIRKGRVICATCDTLMSHGPEPAPGPARAPFARPAHVPVAATPVAIAPPRSSAGTILAIVLAVAAMLLVAGMTLLLADRTERLDATLNGLILANRDRIRTIESMSEERLGALRTESVERSGEFDARVARLEERIENDRTGNTGSFREIRESLRSIDGKLAEVAGLRTELNTSRGQVTTLEKSLEAVRADLALIAEGVIELESKLAGASAPQVPGGGFDEEGGPPPWMGLVEDLKSPNSGTRWNAVQALGETRDVGVLPHLAPMLQDADIFVRMATARILGDLGSPRAIPALIEALGDGEPSVREAAVVSLRGLAGRDFKFDPTASEADRTRKQKAWRDWWKKNEEDILGEDA